MPRMPWRWASEALGVSPRASRYPLNCGRDNFPRFFKRNKMAKTQHAEVRALQPRRGGFRSRL